MSKLRQVFNKIKNKIHWCFKINWIKTWYFNISFFSLKDALKLPVLIFGPCKLTSLKGNFVFNVPIETGIITFGHPFEIFKKPAFGSEIIVDGTWTVNGAICFGIDTKLYIEKNANFEHGAWCTVSTMSKIYCSKYITFGDFVQIGDESMVLDTNFHDLYDLEKKINLPKSGSIHLGSYIYIGLRTTIKSGTIIQDHAMVASNSLCNKDYTSLGSNVLIGGIPAKFIKSGISRDWESEKEQLKNYLTIKL